MQKKTYSQPTVTEHGSAIEKTKGMAGAAWEMWGAKHDAVILPPAEEVDG